MKAHEEKKVRMIKINEATRGDGPQIISYLDSEVNSIRTWKNGGTMKVQGRAPLPLGERLINNDDRKAT